MVIELLDVGIDNAIYCSDIAEILDISIEEVKRHVRTERLQGAPICADNHGYYIPATIEELQRTRSRLFKQARELRKTAQAIDNTLKKMQLLMKADEDSEIAKAVSKTIDEWIAIAKDKSVVERRKRRY